MAVAHPSQAPAPEPPSRFCSGTRPVAMDTPVSMTAVTLPRVIVCHAGALLAGQRHPTLTLGTLSERRDTSTGQDPWMKVELSVQSS